MVVKDIVARIAEINGISKTKATVIINDAFAVIRGALANEETVHISGFGNWQVKATKERNARNPATGEKIVVPAGKKIVFKPSAAVKKSV